MIISLSRHSIQVFETVHTSRCGEKNKNDSENSESQETQFSPLYSNVDLTSDSEVPEIKISVTSHERLQDDHVGNASYQKSSAFGNGFNDTFSTKYGTEHSDLLRSRHSIPDEDNLHHFTEKSPLIDNKIHKRKTSRCSETDSEGSYNNSENENRSSLRRILNYIKITFLCSVMLGSISIFIMVQDRDPVFHQASVSDTDPLYLPLPDENIFPIVHTALRGKFLPTFYDNFSDIDVFVTLQKLDSFMVVRENMSIWRQAFAPPVLWNQFPDITVEHYFDLQNHQEDWVKYSYRLKITTNGKHATPLSVSISEAPRSVEHGVIFATVILVMLYIIIVFDLIHRTLAAMWSGIVAMGVLALLNEKPTLNEVMSWMDIETLGLLFGMMILVAILCETGFFDYVAVLAYKMAKGKQWTVVTLMCFFTGIISAFLDNVTTVLLFTPVTIRLCEVMEIDPKFVLIAIVMFSNVGGTATAVGDPPNVIIVSNSEIAAKGIGFVNFTMHMCIGSIVAMFVTYGMIWLMYRNLAPMKSSEPQEVIELRQEILVWKRAAGSLSLYSRDEKTVRNLLLQKVESLETLLKKRLYDKSPAKEAYEASLLELQRKYKIRNFPLLIKTGIVMFAVILLFFLHAIPQMNISLGWIAIMGAIFLLILADMNEIEHIFARVEWTTLVFFAALFAVMEALNELGLLKFIGTLTENFIKEIPKDMQLGVSIVLILWVSAIASSFIDNIPFTTVMIKIVLQIADNPELDLPLEPLVWALAFGACFGGNGTLIGASANVVCAGVAEQHGYRFTFNEFFKIGFPIMLVTTATATAYLLVCHVAFDWNGTA